MRAWRSVLVVSVLLPLASCGDSTDIAADRGSTEATTTSVEAPTTTDPSTTTSTASSATTTTPRRTTTTTAPRVPTTPGPPQPPVTGSLTTPPTVRVDDYLPTGVPDQINPPQTRAYELLQNGQCGPLLRQIETGEPPTTTPWRTGRVPEMLTDLYTAAANACLARWGPAKLAFSRVVRTNLCEPGASRNFATVEECNKTRELVYDWTAKLLKAHDSNPAFVPNFPTPPKA